MWAYADQAQRPGFSWLISAASYARSLSGLSWAMKARYLATCANRWPDSDDARRPVGVKKTVIAQPLLAVVRRRAEPALQSHGNGKVMPGRQSTQEEEKERPVCAQSSFVCS